MGLNRLTLCDKTRAMKRFLFAAFLFALAAHADTIKIVSSLPRTGSANAQAQTMVNGI